MIQNPTEIKVELDPWLKNKDSQKQAPIAEKFSTIPQDIIRVLNIATWDVVGKEREAVMNCSP